MGWVLAFPIAAITVPASHAAGAWLVRVLAIALAFGAIVFVHEAGHFITARLAGMAVHEFSIGFGRPLLFWFRRGETQYSIRLWPFISYVRIAGMEPDDDHPQGYDKKPRWMRAIVLVAGCLNNFALALVIFIVMGLAIGKGVPSNRVVQVQPKTPAAAAHLQVGDRILGVAGRTGLSVDEIRQAISTSPGRAISLVIERGGERLDVTITPAPTKDIGIGWLGLKSKQVGRIGVAFDTKLVPMGVGEAIATGTRSTIGALQLQVASIAGMLRRQVSPAEVRGPVGVVDMLNQEAKSSWYDFLSLAALLTVGIGFLNLLPIPPLDGSRLLFLGVEAITRRPLDKRKELVINLVGMALLLGFVALLTVRDIARMAHGGG